MTNRKPVTKLTLVSAVVALMLCFAMLLGTTYAWFTDSVTSAGNIIKTGKLDVEMQWANGTEIPNAANWTNAETGAIFNYDRWEPGYVQVRHIRIANVGNLALHYQLQILTNGALAAVDAAGHTLADAIDVYYFDGAQQITSRSQLVSGNCFGKLSDVLNNMVNPATNTMQGDLYPAGSNGGLSEHVVTIALKMRETAGNEYQNKELGASFSVQLLATQLSYERDSFGPDYDGSADGQPDNGDWPRTTYGGTATVTDPTQETVITAGPATLTVPANSSDANDNYQLIVEEAETNGTVTVQTGNGATVYDVTLIKNGEEIVDTDGSTIYTVKLDIGVVDLQEFYHNSTALTPVDALENLVVDSYFYNPSTGIVTFMTKNFSPFTAEYLFAGGIGTEQYPYLLENRLHLYMTGGYYSYGYYFKVKDGITAIDCSNWTSIKYFGGTLDGNGASLTGLDAPLIQFIWDGKSNSTAEFKNLDITCNMYYSDDRGAIVTYSYVKYTVFDNVNIHGLIESPLGCSPYIGYGGYGYNFYYFNNSVSDVSLIATGNSASGFVNHPSFGTSEGPNPSGNCKIFITDSAYIGKISATGTSTENNYNFKYFVVNSNGLDVTTKYSPSFISAHGNPEGLLYKAPTAYTSNSDGSITFNAGNYGAGVVDFYRPNDNANMKALNATFDVDMPEVGQVFAFTKIAGAEKAVVTLEIGANDANGYGNYVGTYETEVIDLSAIEVGATACTVRIKNFIITVIPQSENPGATSGPNADGMYYFVVSGRDGTTYGSACVRIVVFDSYDNVIGVKAISIKK